MFLRLFIASGLALVSHDLTLPHRTLIPAINSEDGSGVAMGDDDAICHDSGAGIGLDGGPPRGRSGKPRTCPGGRVDLGGRKADPFQTSRGSRIQCQVFVQRLGRNRPASVAVIPPVIEEAPRLPDDKV